MQSMNFDVTDGTHKHEMRYLQLLACTKIKSQPASKHQINILNLNLKEAEPSQPARRDGMFKQLIN